MVHYFKKAFLASFFLLFFTNSWSTVVLVQNTNDGGPGSLRDIVNNANPGDTVMMNVKGTITLTSGKIDITTSVTILGAFPIHSTIDCGGAVSNGAFDVNIAGGAQVIIQGFRIINNNTGAQAILKQGNGNLRVVDCLFENNTGGAGGQCIANFSGASAVMEIYNCSFINNSSINPGGAIAINTSSGQTRIRNCTFNQNTANSAGAIYTEGSASIGNCTFHNNTATSNNGADIYFQAGTCEIFNNIFSNTLPISQLFNNPAWNNLGGNVFSGSMGNYGGAGNIGTGPNQLFSQSTPQINLSPSITNDGYGLKYFRLNPGSICINNGVSPGGGLLQTDCRRAPRILMNAIGGILLPDAGAVEYTPFTVTDPNTGANDFYNVWNGNMNTTGPYSGPRYMDFNFAGAGNYILSGTLTNNNLPAGQDWIVDGFTKEGSIIPGPGTTPNSVTPGVFFVNVSYSTSDLFHLTNSGTNSWISGLNMDNNINGNTALECNNSNFKIFGNRIVSSHTGIPANKSGIYLSGSADCVIGGWRHHQRNVISQQGYGIFQQSPHSIVSGNFIGTTDDGLNSLMNYIGIYHDGGIMDIVGKYRFPSMNLISGNQAAQYWANSGSFFNIHGNLIGPDYTAVNLLTTGAPGIVANINTDGQIGTGMPNDFNVIGGNAEGILISSANNVIVLGNFIGISAEPGFPAIPNNNGVVMISNGDSNHSVGDGTFKGRNFISGNSNFGVYVNAASGHTIRGNFIGLKPDNTPGGNGFHGIYVDANSDNLMISDNVISNNNGDGISYDQAGDIDQIQYNKIGTDSTGNVAIGNINGIRFNNLGGSDIDVNNNQISGNSSSGILITNNSTSVIVRSNNIGLNAAMTGVLGNSIGINTNIANDLTIEFNTVAGNSTRGLYLGNLTTSDITGNYIGTNSSMATGLGNGSNGVEFYGSSFNNMVGGTNTGDENFITNNTGFGVYVNASSNSIGIINNIIYDNSDLGISLTGNSGSPLVNDTGDADAVGTFGNAGQNYPDNLVAANCSGGPILAGDIECDQAGNYTLQIFRINPGVLDPSGHGEGNEYITEVTLAFVVGNNTFSIPLPGTIIDNDILSVTSTFYNGTGYSTSEFSDTVLVKPQFIANATILNNVLCFGGSDGVITATHGGPGPFFYNWYDNSTTLPIGQSTLSATVPAGDYYLEISTTTCLATTNIVTVTEPTQLSGFITPTDPTCFGGTDGAIDFTPSGGTSPYFFDWSNDGTGDFDDTEDLINLTSGSYGFTVQDNNGCLFSIPTTNLFNPAQLVVTPVVSDETCDGLDDGTLTLNATGGVAPYQYKIDLLSYGASSTFTGLSDGLHTWDVIDANGCTVGGNISILAGEVVTANFTANSGCQNQPVINFTDLSSAPSSISSWNWTFPIGTSPLSSSSQNPFNINFSTPGSNNVTLDIISGNGCTATITLPVNIFPTPVADAGLDDAICEGDPFTHTANIVGGTLGYDFNWFPNSGHFVDDTIQNPTILGSLSSTPGVYTHVMNVTDANGCVDTDTMFLTINALPVVDAGAPQSVCLGNSVTLAGSGSAISYSWDNLVSDGISFSPSVTTLYTVTGTDGNGCQNTDTVTVSVQTPYTIDAGADFSICETAATLTLNGTCSGPASWSSTGTGSYSPSNTTLNASYSITPGDVSAGTITFTLATAANGACSSVTDDVIVTIDLQPLADAGTLPSTDCNSNTLTLSGSVNNAASFSWTTDGTGNIQDANLLTTPYSPDIGETGMVTFYLTTSTNGNCPSHVDSVSINLIDAPVANAGVDNTICSGQTYTLDGTGSTNTTIYDWYEVSGPPAGNTPTFSTTTVSPTVTTSYYLIADNGICADNDTVTITVVAAPDATFTYGATGFCQDHANILPTTINTPGGTFTMPLSPGSINSSTGEINFSSLSPGTYRVYYTLTTPCTAVDSIDIDVLSLPDATITGTVYLCVGNGAFNLSSNSNLFPATTLTGGSWSGPGVGGGTFTPGTAGAGSHIITYSVTDGNGCFNSDTALIFIHTQPSVSISGVPSNICETDPIFTPIGTPSGGFWLYDGVGYGSTISIDPDTISTNGLHTVSYQFTDPVTGCTATTIPPTGFTLFFLPLDPTTTQATTQTVCAGTSLSLVASNPNGTGTSLAWYSDIALTNQIASGPTFNTPVLTNTTTYYVVVQNNGCKSNPIVFNIIVNSANVSAGPDLFICPGTPAQLNVSTATGTISWSPGNTLNDSTIQNPIATPNVNTTYVVTVINGSCVDSDSVNVVIDGSNPDCGVVPSYNAFSPDGDGVNDTWIIDAVALHPNNHLTIFNRWGDKLVEFEDYDNVTVVWDGTYKGNLLPSGTYYYVIEYLDINIQVSGWLQITH